MRHINTRPPFRQWLLLVGSKLLTLTTRVVIPLIERAWALLAGGAATIALTGPLVGAQPGADWRVRCERWERV